MLSDELINRRLRLGMSQVRLADRLQISRSALQRFERGDYPVPAWLELAVMHLRK